MRHHTGKREKFEGRKDTKVGDQKVAGFRRPQKDQKSKMSSLLLLLLLLLPLSAARLPMHDWSTTPVFWHSANQSGWLNDDVLDLLGRFSVATLEKSTMRELTPVNASGEAKVIAQARAIKARHPTMPVMFYHCSMGWNLAPSEGGYDLYTKLPEGLWLRDAAGHLCTAGRGRWKIFDLTQPEMVKRWLATAASAKATGAIDGLFVDSGNLKVGPSGGFESGCKLTRDKAARWNAAHAALLPAAQQVFGDDGIVFANNMDFPDTAGRFFEFFLGPDVRFNATAGILSLQKEDAAGRWVEAHGSPTPMGSGAFCSGPDAEACEAAAWARLLAGFLIGAGNRAFFFVSEGWSNLSPLARSWSWDRWHPDLGRPLGAPAGTAEVAACSYSRRTRSPGAGGGWLWTRRFATGTNVSFYSTGHADAGGAVGCVEWSDGGKPTGTCPPHPPHESFLSAV